MKTNKTPSRRHTARFLALEGFLTALLWLLPAGAHAQAIEAWVQRYNGPGNGSDSPSAMAVDTNGNVIVTGYSWGGASFSDFTTIKYSNVGVALWTNRYNGPGNLYDDVSALAVDGSNDVIVTGFSDGGGSSTDYLTIKYSSAGVPLWTNRYNGPANDDDRAAALAVDDSNNVIVTGYSYGNGSSADYLTIKYSSTGVPLWTNRYNGPANSSDQATAVALDSDNNVIVTGESFPIGSPTDYLTIKYSSEGVPLWTNRYNGPGNFPDDASDVAVDHDNNIIVTGHSIHNYGNGNFADYLTIKYSSTGMPLWTNRYNGSGNGYDYARFVAVDASNNVIVTGYSLGNGSSADYTTIKYSTAGVPLWTNRYDGPVSGYEEPTAMAVDARGNVIVTGYSDGSTNAWNDDYLTIKYSSAGVPLWTNRYTALPDDNDQAKALTLDAVGNVFVTSYSYGNHFESDYATIKYSVVPLITSQPLSRTNAVGSTASFTVEAGGDAPLSYQWRRQGTNLVNGGNLSGVTTPNLLLTNVQLADAAGYSVVITNAYGSVTSTVAQLTVYIPPNPGRFTNFSYSPVMGFSFIFRDGAIGRTYRIQVSPSLAEGSWVDWVTFNYVGPIIIGDLGATGQEHRFYRAVSP